MVSTTGVSSASPASSTPWMGFSADFAEGSPPLSGGGTRLHVIDRWYPSSKTYSNCGTVKAKLSLSERVYHCGKCGLVIDRDLNAAINIQVAGSALEMLNARGGDVRQTGSSRTMLTPVKREPSGGASRVRLGAGLGNEAMQMTSL